MYFFVFSQRFCNAEFADGVRAADPDSVGRRAQLSEFRSGSEGRIRIAFRHDGVGQSAADVLRVLRKQGLTTF